MILHQKTNSIGSDIYSGFLYRAYNWVLHMHKSLEFTYVIKGTLVATVGQNRYELTAGQFVFVMPYQPHSYASDEDTVFFISCFSKNHIPYFVSDLALKEPDCSCIRLSADVAHYFLKIHNVDTSDLSSGVRCELCAKPSMYARKAALYAICDEIINQSTWHPKSSDSDIVFKILSYIEQNFTESISLSDMANALSYEYHYLSRIFHIALGTSFTALVNQYRCEKAHLLLTESDESISDIALSCGFQSIRTFNRIFFDYCGQTPSNIRSRKNII